MVILMRARTSALAVVVLAGVLVACSGRHSSPQRDAVQRFLTALGAGDAAAAARLTTDPTAAYSAVTASLGGLGSGTRGTLHTTGTSDGPQGAVDVHYSASWHIPAVSTAWTYDAVVPVRRVGRSWQVVWQPSDLHPGLRAGEHLVARREQPARAPLRDSSGVPIFTETPVVTVGLERRLITALPSIARTLSAIPELQSTAAEITAAVAKAQPTEFVPVITLRRSVYERIKARIHDLPGTVFQESTRLLPPSAGFAQRLLGAVGPATAEIVKVSKGRVADGDSTGLGGLEQALDPTLAGTAGLTVVAEPDDPHAGAPARTLADVVAPEPGTAVTLTLDRRVQAAAEQALAGVRQQASVVAVQPSTGRVLADANTAATTYDLGLAGALPPGSTFKIATWLAAFTANPSLTPETRVPCPATVTVDGRRFENENRFSYPPIPVSAAFGYSCNTSAISQGVALPDGALAAAAKSLGLGAAWSLPVEAFSGAVPPPRGLTERAADAIGQGRVQVSPLLMASMAGAASTGTPVVPSIVAGRPGAKGTPLDPAVVSKMRVLLSTTVDLPAGTAHELAGRGVLGKTGTAEYGTATPPRSHSWFAGTRGDLAFAVFVYDGASAGVRAVPITKAFLTALG